VVAAPRATSRSSRHHRAPALGLARRGYVLENGRVVLEGTGRELLGNEHVKRAYLGM
jgi:ABC-type branched-subunit amino acid transport system ATPase component